jgi:hypothetical protein
MHESLRSNMSPQIDQLASELLHIIISNLNPGDLQNCRLVQRRWRDIGNEYLLRAIHTNTTTKLLHLMDSLAEYDNIAGHVRSITIAKKKSEKWPGQGNASEMHNPALLGQEYTSSRYNYTFLAPFKVPFKRLERLVVLDGRPFPTISWPRDWPLNGDATTEQLENLQPALANSAIHLSELCVEWVNTQYFPSKAAEIGQIWRSLTILRLALTCNEDLSGVRDLNLVLRGLFNLEQLHLSTLEDYHLPLHRLIDEREVAWPRLTHLTLRGFVAREPILQTLFSLPHLRSVSMARMDLDGDGCWIRIMTALRMRKCTEVHLSGWLANPTTTALWFGDSTENGSLFREVTEWLKRDDGEAGSCPLNISNMD